MTPAVTMRLTHIGGPTLLIEVGPWRVLTDPTFDAPGRRYAFALGASSRKVVGPAIAPDSLGRIDAVLLSHDQHADNLDDAGRALLPAAGVVVTTVVGAARLGSRCATRGLAPWSTTRLEREGYPSIEITATPCRHGPPIGHLVAGAVIGFSLTWLGQAHGAVWISGDTVMYGGVRRVAQRIHVGTALLHLGGVRFPITGPLRYTFTAADAVEVARLMQPRTVIPLHYDGWSHFQQGRATVDRALAVQGRGESLRRALRWIEPGQPVDIDP